MPNPIASWGAAPDGRLLLLDLLRQRLEGPDIVPAICRAVEAWQLAFVGVEKVGFQLALIQDARRAGLPIRELEADRDKVVVLAQQKKKKRRGKPSPLPDDAPRVRRLYVRATASRPVLPSGMSRPFPAGPPR